MLDEDRQVLEDAAGTSQQVRVHVSSCIFECCGQGWQHRNYWGEHVGIVSELGDNHVQIQVTGLGRLSRMIASNQEVLGVELVD